MIATLMNGLVERDMQAVINSYDLKPYYYPTLFPLKERFTLTWKALETQVGLKIAADIVARGARVDAKTREAVARLQGDIPKISIKRYMDEDRLNEYDIMVAMSSGNPDLQALVSAWAEDTDFCWTGVASRLEWMALQELSLGKITLNEDNNTSVLTEYDVDYLMDEKHKVGYQEGSASWSQSSAAKPITKDFKNIVKQAKKEGINLKVAMMSLDTFATFTETDEVQRICASFAANALNISQTPSLEQVNTALSGLSYLRGLQVKVIDQDITLEKSDGTRPFSGNPFTENVVNFGEAVQKGYTYWKKPADASVKGSVAIKAMNGHTLIKKYAEEEPLMEVTQGVANAFPGWLSSSRSILMSTDSENWNH